MELFDLTNMKCSKLITNSYSTSFSLGIRALNQKFRLPVCAVYGFVRYADEIVDTFHDKDKETLLSEFRDQTYQSIRRGISLNPVLHSFQIVVNRYKIEQELIDAFLKSMEADLYNKFHDPESYNTYIYGSAEVVGLMCLRIFCEGNEQQYNELKPFAQSLGAAFQKVNFLRDVQSDFQERGRIYFPGINFNTFSKEAKAAIEQDICDDFDRGLCGIKKLPMGSRFGVYLAYIYYRSLFNKIKSLPVSRIQTERIRIPDQQKLMLFVQSWLKYKFI